VIGKYISDLFNFFDFVHDVHFFLFIIFQFLVVLMEEVTIGTLMPSWVTFFICTIQELW
jgi:hypothetical protein